ncbi:hypothetical protein M2G70_07370 [Vibrio vulnificus]|nr:hypothetical protein [Vibrio vulnificus]
MKHKYKKNLYTRMSHELYFKFKSIQKEALSIKPRFEDDSSDPEFLQCLMDGLADFCVHEKDSRSEPHYLYHLRNPEDAGSLSKGYIGVTSNPLHRFKEHSKGLLKLNPNAQMEILLRGTSEFIYTKEAELRPTEHIGWNKRQGGSKAPSSTGRKFTYKSLEIKENCYRRFKKNHVLYYGLEPYRFEYASHFAKEIQVSVTAVLEVLKGQAFSIKGFTLEPRDVVPTKNPLVDFEFNVIYDASGKAYKNIKASEIIRMNPKLSLYTLRQLQDGVVKSTGGFRTLLQNTPHFITSITIQNLKTQEVITASSVKELSHLLAPRDISTLIAKKQRSAKGFRLIEVKRGSRGSSEYKSI